jgi:hypothetical protein
LMKQGPFRISRVFQLFKKFPVFYGTWLLITVFTKARHLFLTWTTSIHSTSSLYFLKLHFNIIFPPTLRNSKWSLSLRFPHENPVRTSPLPCTCRTKQIMHEPVYIVENDKYINDEK